MQVGRRKNPAKLEPLLWRSSNSSGNAPPQLLGRNKLRRPANFQQLAAAANIRELLTTLGTTLEVRVHLRQFVLWQVTVGIKHKQALQAAMMKDGGDFFHKHNEKP
jgi:hypothetical protein